MRWRLMPSEETALTSFFASAGPSGSAVGPACAVGAAKSASAAAAAIALYPARRVLPDMIELPNRSDAEPCIDRLSEINPSLGGFLLRKQPQASRETRHTQGPSWADEPIVSDQQPHVITRLPASDHALCAIFDVAELAADTEGFRVPGPRRRPRPDRAEVVERQQEDCGAHLGADAPALVLHAD